MNQRKHAEPTGDEFEAMVDRLTVHIDAEYGEVNNRTNWMLVFHGFLLAALPFALSADPAGSILSEWPLLIPVIALLTAGIHALAVYASLSVIRDLKRRRSAVIERAKSRYHAFEPIGVPLDDHRHKLGVLPAVAYPVILLLAWLVIGGHEYLKRQSPAGEPAPEIVQPIEGE